MRQEATDREQVDARADAEQLMFRMETANFRIIFRRLVVCVAENDDSRRDDFHLFSALDFIRDAAQRFRNIRRGLALVKLHDASLSRLGPDIADDRALRFRRYEAVDQSQARLFLD